MDPNLGDEIPRRTGRTARFARPPGGPVPPLLESRIPGTAVPSGRTLDSVRPHTTRPQNEYIDHPVKSANNNIQSDTWNASDTIHRQTSSFLNNQNGNGQTLPITSQPVSAGLKKKVEEEQHQKHQTESIICPRCQKCKCQSCTRPRSLPSRWICNKSVECSAQKAVDIISCVCCIKCVFYHCLNFEEDSNAEEDPCSCLNEPNCCKRWACMGLLTVCLPCLCLYWPLQCGLYMCTACYNRCSRRGCNCRRENTPSANKRLLFDSESSSA